MSAKTWLRKLVGGTKAARAAGKPTRARPVCEPLEDRRVPAGGNYQLTIASGHLALVADTGVDNDLTVRLDNADPTAATHYVISDTNECITLGAGTGNWSYTNPSDGHSVTGPKSDVSSIGIDTKDGFDIINLGTSSFAAVDAPLTVKSSTGLADQFITVAGAVLAPTGNVELDGQDIGVNATIRTGDQTDASTGTITLNANVTNGGIDVGATGTLATGNVSHSSGGGDSGSITLNAGGAGGVVQVDGTVQTGNVATPISGHHSGDITATAGTAFLYANGTVATGTSDGASGNVSLVGPLPVINGQVTTGASNGTSGSITVGDTASTIGLQTGNASLVQTGSGTGGNSTTRSGSVFLNVIAGNTTIDLEGPVRTGNEAASGSHSGDITLSGANGASGSVVANATLATGSAGAASGNISINAGAVSARVEPLLGLPAVQCVTLNASVSTGAASGTSGNITVSAGDILFANGSVRSGDSTHSGSVRLSTSTTSSIGGGGVQVNSAVATGDATQADTAGADTPSSGSITITSAGGAGGNGTLTTGNAAITAPVIPVGVQPLAVAADTVTSGNISVTAASAIAFTASPSSLVIGTASRTATPPAGTATSGSINLQCTGDIGGLVAVGGGGALEVLAPLNVTIGPASGAATNRPGILTASATPFSGTVGSAAGDASIAATGALTTGNVTVANNLNLSAGGPLTVGDGTVSTQTVSSGASGSFALSAAGHGVTIATNGVLSGNGTVGTAGTNDALTNAGAIKPGGSGAIGTITANGNYTQTATGTLAVEISGSTTPTYDQLAVSGTVLLGGTLNVIPIGTFAPANRSRFNVLSFNGRLAGANNLPSDFATKTYQDGVTLQAAYNGGYNATLLTLEFLNVAATDVTSSTRVTRGGAFVNTATKHITQTVTVTNTSGGTISGPIYLALSIPSSNFHLANAAGVTVMTSPTGQPYVVLSLDDLAPGASVSFTLDFTYATSPAGFAYTARVLAGGNP